MSNRPMKQSTSMRHTRLTSGLAVLALGAQLSASTAQQDLPAGSPGRFTMQPADGGILRLDTQTGTLSMCRQTAGSWACQMVADDRKAANEEIARLKTENDDLKSSVKRLEDLAGVPDAQRPGAKDGTEKRQSGMQLPSEEDVDKAMSYVQRMLKKFKDKLKELESDQKKGTQL